MSRQPTRRVVRGQIQFRERGKVSHAYDRLQGRSSRGSGGAIAGVVRGLASAENRAILDLTGLGVQSAVLAQAVPTALRRKRGAP